MKVTNASVHVDVQCVKLDPAGTQQRIGLERLAFISRPDLRMHTSMAHCMQYFVLCSSAYMCIVVVHCICTNNTTTLYS